MSTGLEPCMISSTNSAIQIDIHSWVLFAAYCLIQIHIWLREMNTAGWLTQSKYSFSILGSRSKVESNELGAK